MTAQTPTSNLRPDVFHGIYDLELRIAAETDRDAKLRLIAHHNTVMGFLTAADLSRYEDFKASYAPMDDADLAVLRVKLETVAGHFTESGTL